MVINGIMNKRVFISFTVIIFITLVIYGSIPFFKKPSIENKDLLGDDELLIFFDFLEKNGYYTGKSIVPNIFQMNFIDRIYFSESIVDIGKKSKVTSSMRVWFEGAEDPERYLLIDGKVIKVNQFSVPRLTSSQHN